MRALSTRLPWITMALPRHLHSARSQPMDPTLADLQTRLTYQEDDLHQINRELAQQRRELEQVKARLAHLERRLHALTPSQVGNAADEPPPPHY
jgi:SlyX protein